MSVIIHNGDALEVLRTLPAQSVHMCVTSPPYYGLRDYGVAGQIGLEETLDEYIAKLVAVFAEVRRVMRDDGTLWVNMGDSYAGNGGQSPQMGALFKGRARQRENACLSLRGAADGVKPKDLMGVPWMLAFALRADGWFLRQDIIWSKPNPMPESVRNRCTKAHEYLFLLSKGPRYYFDSEAIREDAKTAPGAGWAERKAAGATRGNVAFNGNVGAGTQRGVHGDGISHNLGNPDGKRNRRSVWTVATQPFRGAHFATFPPQLIEPCILAGCPIGGTVLDPFGGSGTTGLVADRLQRSATLIELNPEYVVMAARRVDQGALPLFSKGAA